MEKGIVFASACPGQERPVRLPEWERNWAWESLNGKYGDEALVNDSVSMDDWTGFASMNDLERQDAMIQRIAGTAPLRYVPGESVSGSATLGQAVKHVIPAKFQGETVLSSVSHLTLNFGRVVREGINALEQRINERLTEEKDEDGRDFLKSCAGCINAMRVYRDRYVEFLQDKAPENAQRLQQVPFYPARDFREAVQSIWFTFSFARLCGNWPGIGRLDWILEPYLQADLQSGAITLDEARVFLAGFFIKGCEWVRTTNNPNSGDGQNYQNIVLAGIDRDGNEVTGEATRLILEIVEELPIGDFPITIRLNDQQPEWLREQAAKVVRHGGGVVAFYNEKLILEALQKFGYPEKEARMFANDGCWEIQIPGKTRFGYIPFDGLRILLVDTLHLDSEPAHFDSYEELRNAYFINLNKALEGIFNQITSYMGTWEEDGSWKWKNDKPCTVVSLFEDGCIEKGRNYFSGGPVYNVISPHIGGAADVGNSLYAIHKLCFEEKRLSLDELLEIVRNNWEGEESLRQYALGHLTYYGNDNDEADSYTTDVLHTFSDLVSKLDGRCEIRFPAGVSTFGRQIEWAPKRTATPFGRRQGDILSGNTSPTPGTDTAGATALIASYCKTDMHRLANGAALDVKLSPSAVRGEGGVQALTALMNGFCFLGGCFVQIDVVDTETLRRAQENPEMYRTLSVRVSGWNARFVTLDSCWQQMIIERSERGL